MSATDLIILTSGMLLGAAVLLVALVAWIESTRPPLPTALDVVREVAARKAGPDCPAFGLDTDCKAAPGDRAGVAVLLAPREGAILDTICKLERKADRWARRGKPLREKLVIVAVFGIVFGPPTGAIWGLAYGSAVLSCRNSWSESGREWRVRAFSGCQVRDKGGWIPAGNVRAVD